MKQTTDKVLMVRPCSFGYNEETAVNNAFQTRTGGDVQAKALAEFDAYVALLRSYGVGVEVVDDTPSPLTPDSVFPNNWFSMHEGGTLVLYPMFAENRRKERKQTVIDRLLQNYNINSLIDLTPWEDKGLFLEGTGSMVLDRAARIAYACLSPRTSMEVLNEFCKALDFRPVTFHASDAAGRPIYHTNVMMSVGTRNAVVCIDSVKDPGERKALEDSLVQCNKQLVQISFEQMNGFAGNMLELCSDGTGSTSRGKALQVMSLNALHCLTQEQRLLLSAEAEIVAPDINVIETNGGGSARCMLAELFY
jgi:hypothetical protein